MKNKVERRLKEVKNANPTNGAIAEQQLLHEMKKLTVLVDAVQSRGFGFVSHFKGVKTELWRHRQHTVLSAEETAKKVEEIKAEYACALEIAPTIDKIAKLLTETYQGNLEQTSKTKRVTTTSKVATRMRWLKKTADKALNGCIKKGYNEPAIQILTRLCQPKDNADLDMSILVPELTDEYIKKITANYAKKRIYRDESSYLYEEYRNKEIDVENLGVALKTGAFGEKFKTSQYRQEIKDYYHHVIQSALYSETAQNLSHTENAGE